MTPVVVDLNARGLLLAADGSTPIPGFRIADHLAAHLRIPENATDLFVYVHGWKTKPQAAVDSATRLIDDARTHHSTEPGSYPRLDQGFRPWTLVIRWPSSSSPTPTDYSAIRDRAHAMSRHPGHPDGPGYAPQVIAHLLGYLHTHREDPTAPQTLATHTGQYLHVVGHSFGGRLLCEGLQWAAIDANKPAPTLSWSTPHDPRRPFTVDSSLIFQMAAPRDVFETRFPYLFPQPGQPGAPLRGPLTLTHSRHDHATGRWHRIAEGSHGIGYAGTSTAPVAQHTTRLHAVGEPYTLAELDHRLVNVDASAYYRAGGLTGAHSDFHHPETSHLLLSLAEHSRPV